MKITLKDVLSHVTKSPEAWFPQIGSQGSGFEFASSLSHCFSNFHFANSLLLWQSGGNLVMCSAAGSEAAFKDLATLSMGNIVLVDDQRANFQSQFGASRSEDAADAGGQWFQSCEAVTKV